MILFWKYCKFSPYCQCCIVGEGGLSEKPDHLQINTVKPPCQDPVTHKARSGYHVVLLGVPIKESEGNFVLLFL